MTVDVSEWCEKCSRETVHAARLEVRTESANSPNPAHSREPYRIATCEVCGTTMVQRMNKT